jgi:hypothetical protein
MSTSPSYAALNETPINFCNRYTEINQSNEKFDIQMIKEKQQQKLM